MTSDDLTPAEQRLVAAFRQGEDCDFAEGQEVRAGDMDGWHSDRCIRAEVITQLLTERGPGGDGPRLLSLRGARVVGRFGKISGQKVCLSARSCRFDDEVTFSDVVFGDGSGFDFSRFRGKVNFFESKFSSDVSFIGCVFREMANFGAANFKGKATFERSLFEGDAIFTETLFCGSASFARSYFRKAVFRYSSFQSNATFDTATFEIALFKGANFDRPTKFHQAVFVGTSEFIGTAFHREADFRNCTFLGDAGFREASFLYAARFNNATFIKTAVFKGAAFSGNAVFAGALAVTWLLDFATIESSELGPFVGSRISMRYAKITARTQLTLFATEVSAVHLRAPEGIHFVIHCGRSADPERLGGVDFSDAEFLRATIIQGESEKPEVPTRRSNNESNWPQSYRQEIARTSARAEARKLYEYLCHDLQGMKPGLLLRSLRRSTLGEVALSGIDLSDCKFSGAHGLDGMRIGAKCTFQTTPNAWLGRIPNWASTRRRVIAEEIEWREVRCAPTGSPQMSTGLAEAEIAAIYRDLRKSLEDNKNEPAATDFYYGEMEMRRLGGGRNRSDANVLASSSRVERTLLTAYWALAGYGLRAWRALVALLFLVVSSGILFSCAGWASKEVARRAAFINPDNGIISYAGPTYHPVDLWTGLEFSLRESIALLQARSLPLYTGTFGTALDILLRLAGPLLLAFAVLALRARTKR